jgi:hypothetical protein
MPIIRQIAVKYSNSILEFRPSFSQVNQKEDPENQ